MTRSNWLILALAVLAATAGGYVERRQHQSPEDSALPGQPLPAIRLPDPDGRMHWLSDYRGRRVLLNFWASWCGPCLDEMPELSRAQARFGGSGSAPIIVGIAMDEPARVRAFVTAHPPGYPVLLGQLAAPSTSLRLGDVREVLPYSVLVDADGHILATHTGVLSAAQIAQWLAPRSTP